MLPARSKSNAIRSIKPDIKVSFFSDEDIINIMKYIDEKMQYAKTEKRKLDHGRYKFLVTVLLRTGARISEALMLRPEDFDLMTGNVNIVTLKKAPKKNGSELAGKIEKKLPRRTLPIHPELREMATGYFLASHTDIRSGERIFPVSRITVDKYFTRMERGIGIKINAHKFRHTFAVRSLMDGVPINVLQKWLAHSSLIVTSVYADVLSMDTSMFMKQVH